MYYYVKLDSLLKTAGKFYRYMCLSLLLELKING